MIPVAEQLESCYNLRYLVIPICNRQEQIGSELKVPEMRAKAWVSGRARPGTYSSLPKGGQGCMARLYVSGLVSLPQLINFVCLNAA